MAPTSSPSSRSSRVPSLAKYDVVDELGHGGMATVYRAHDRRLGRDVAVKVLHPHLRDSREIAHRFAVEARAVAKLRHPNIVEVYDVSSEDDDEQYLVVELLRGLTLRKILQRYGPLPPEVAAAIGVELASALAHAHAQGVVHRDVKPENVIVEHPSFAASTAPSSRSAVDVTPAPTSGRAVTEAPTSGPSSEDPRGPVRVKLTDFGIAKLLDAQGVTSTGQVLGSPAHMAPEQIEGGEVDERADVFGLGVLLYECMVGHLPFEGANPAQVLRRVLEGVYPPAERERTTVGKVWSDLLDRALARDREGRFRDLVCMRDALAQELGRLGFPQHQAELRGFFDDQATWEREHEKKLVARLKELGAEARKKRDVHGAAAAYNRALAYTPQDTELLRIVSTMSRREARLRLVRRTAPPLALVIALGVGAFYGARALRGPAIAGPDPSARPSASAPPVVSVASATPSASAAPSASVAEVKTSATVIAPPPKSARPPEKDPVRRHVVLGSVSPPMGVRVSVDGRPPEDATSGARFEVDDKPHEIFFTCSGDVCDVQKRGVAAGDKDEVVQVDMRIKDAALVIEGSPRYTYTVRELPGQTFHVGQSQLPMKSGTRVVHVSELETSTTVSVTLRAGGTARATFAPTPGGAP